VISASEDSYGPTLHLEAIADGTHTDLTQPDSLRDMRDRRHGLHNACGEEHSLCLDPLYADTRRKGRLTPSQVLHLASFNHAVMDGELLAQGAQEVFAPDTLWEPWKVVAARYP
jgi:hypothetical protein